MFSGIIEEAAYVAALTEIDAGGHASLRVMIESRMDHSDTKRGDSIAVNGVCLTVVEKKAGPNGTEISFDVVPETVRRSTFTALRPGARVNLERSLKVGDRIHGHLVTGHIDGTTSLLERTDEGNALRFDFALPADGRRMIVTKGSIALQGVSLTVGPVTKELFTVWIIPHTASVTTLGELSPGDSVNFEFDPLARYVAAALAAREA